MEASFFLVLAGERFCDRILRSCAKRALCVLAKGLMLRARFGGGPRGHGRKNQKKPALRPVINLLSDSIQAASGFHLPGSFLHL
ncbi:hypothetical protein B6S59_06895 [Pseudomonas sp. A46]|nr:hypothetical protein B6S59_06895 [Pseudomonas sp. A46]